MAPLPKRNPTIVVHGRDFYPGHKVPWLLGMTFTDTLAILEADGSWQIYDKLFHVEGPAS